METQRATKTTQTQDRQPSAPTKGSQPPSALVQPIVQLQQNIGNQAVQRFLRPRVIQAKLKISLPDDIYEKEADRVADEVMRMPAPALQRTCASCADSGTPCPKCRDGEPIAVQRKTPLSSDGSTEAVPDDFLQSIGPGQPIDFATRTFFEPRFGYDFSQVRIHTDARAAESARELNAVAYTVGSDVVFGAGQYEPQTADGRRLLGHELTHVVQQQNTIRTMHAEPITLPCIHSIPTPTLLKKPVKKPYRGHIVPVITGGTAVVQTCQNTKAEGCRTDVLFPGMEVTVTDEFAGGAWLFVQNLPEEAVKALHGQKWVYIPAKYVVRTPEGPGEPGPSSKRKSDKQAGAAARAQQLKEAIYSKDNETVIKLLNEGGLQDALELLGSVEEKAESKGEVAPVAYVCDDFSLEVGKLSELRVAVAAHTIELSAGLSSGSPADTYDALMAAARRLGDFAPGTVSAYVAFHGREDVKAVVEQRRTEQIREFGEQYERAKAAEKDPLAVFQQRLKEKALEVLDQNEAAVRKQRKALAGQDSSDAAWKRLETVVLPQAIVYGQLGGLEDKLTSLVTHTAKAIKYAEESDNDRAAVEYSEQRGEPPEDAWWRPNRFPVGGGGANWPPPIAEIRDELEKDREQLKSVQNQRTDLKNRFPLVKALRPALLEKLAKGPSRKDSEATAEFRRAVFADLENQVFEVALSAIRMLRGDIESGSARLYSFTPLVDEVKSELMLGADQEAKIDNWVKENKERVETIMVATGALSIALTPLMFVPGGQLVVAIVGVLSAAYGLDVTGEQYVAAKAGMAGKDITEKSLEEARWDANMALLDLVLSGLDLGTAVKTVTTTRRIAKTVAVAEELGKARRIEQSAKKAASVGEELAEETRRTEQSGKKASTLSKEEELADEASRSKRAAERPVPAGPVPGLPACGLGSIHCPINYLRQEFSKLFKRRETAEFARYIHPAAEEIDALTIRRSLRREMTILTGERMYQQFLEEVAEQEWSEPFKEAVANARNPGVDHRIISVKGSPMKWPLDGIGDPWVVHHDPPLNWTTLSEGPHLWHPMPYAIHDEAHAWWRELENELKARVKSAGGDIFTADFDVRKF